MYRYIYYNLFILIIYLFILPINSEYTEVSPPPNTSVAAEPLTTNYTVSWENQLIEAHNGTLIVTPFCKTIQIDTSYNLFPIPRPSGLKLSVKNSENVQSIDLDGSVDIHRLIDLTNYTAGAISVTFVVTTNDTTVIILNPEYTYYFKEIKDIVSPPASNLIDSSIPIIDSSSACQVSYTFHSSDTRVNGNSYNFFGTDDKGWTTTLQPNLYLAKYTTSNYNIDAHSIFNLQRYSTSLTSSLSSPAGCSPILPESRSFGESDSFSLIEVPYEPLMIVILKSDKLFGKFNIGQSETSIDGIVNLRCGSGYSLYSVASEPVGSSSVSLSAPLFNQPLLFSNYPSASAAQTDSVKAVIHSTQVTYGKNDYAPNIPTANAIIPVDDSVLFEVNLTITSNNYQSISYFVYDCDGDVFFVDKQIYSANYVKRINIPNQMFTPNGNCTLHVTAYGKTMEPQSLFTSKVVLNLAFISGWESLSAAIVDEQTISTFYLTYQWRAFSIPTLNVNLAYHNTKLTLPNRAPYIYKYPHYFIGNFDRMLHSPNIRVLYEDANPQIALGASFNMSGRFENLYALGNAEYNENSSPDLQNPFVKVQIGFNSDYTNITYFINVTDDRVGIDESSCYISIGPYKSFINSTNLISGNRQSGIYYIISYFNLAYCFEPIALSCADTYGNILRLNTSEPFSEYVFNYSRPAICSNSQVDIRPIYTTIKYHSPIDITYSMVLYNNNAQQSTTSNHNIVQLTLCKDIHCKSIETTNNMVNINNNNAGLSVYSMNYTFKDQSHQYYPTIMVVVNNNNNNSTIIYNQIDLKYFLITNNNLNSVFAKPTINFFIKSTKNNYIIPLPTIIVKEPIVILAIPKADVQISIVKLVYINGKLPNIERFSWDLSIGDTDNSERMVNLTLPNYMKNAGSYVFIEELCDVSGYCESLPAVGRFSNQLFSSPSTSPTMKSTFTAVTLNYTKQIDSTSNKRQFQASIKITPGGLLEPAPLLYIQRNDTHDYITCQTTFVNVIKDNSSIVSCSMTIPSGWGVNSAPKLSLHGLHKDLVAEFVELNDAPFTISPFNGPKLWNAKYSFTSRKISITGYYLGYLVANNNITGTNSQYPVSIKGTSNKLVFTLQSPTSAYAIISDTTFSPTSNFNITCNNIDTLVIIESCMSPTCSNNGKCNLETHTCECNGGWLGVACDVADVGKVECGPNGEFRSMACQCKNNYIGPNCEHKNSITMDMKIMNDRPLASFIPSPTSNPDLNQASIETNFTMDLVEVVELDVAENIVQTYILNEWQTLSRTNDSTYQFSHALGSGELVITILVNQKESTFEWANDTLMIPANSFKYGVKLEQYTFGSQTNRLQFKWCTQSHSSNYSDANSDFGGSSNSDIHWTLLGSNQLQLFSRFNNKIIVDDQILEISNRFTNGSKTSQNYIVVTVPSFNKRLLMDPDFSVLTRFNSENNGSTNSNQTVSYKWAIIVAVVLVSLAVIITVLIFLIKKNTLVRTKVLAFQQKRRNQLIKNKK